MIVELGGPVLVDTTEALRVLETSHPPVYYLPRSAFPDAALQEVGGTSWCEFKGTAHSLDVLGGDRRATRAGWFYPDPSPGFEELRDKVALYPRLLDRVSVAGETVRPQEGGFYGGWITDRVVGPFKGPDGTSGW